MTIASAAADAGLHVRHQISSQHAVMPPEMSCTHLLAGAWLRRTPIIAGACHAYTNLAVRTPNGSPAIGCARPLVSSCL
ncbi:hypothetical protein IG631_11306 [Alternaria alternata]|nr:hypothetical protein IG631_11306 [Alternaria alternata]